MHNTVLSISYDKSTLDPSSVTAKRMLLIGNEIEELHIVVFSLKKHSFTKKVQYGNVIVYPTNTVTSVGMLIAALRIGSAIIKASQQVSWNIFTQDPFESGVVGYMLRLFYPKSTLSIQEHGNFYGHTYWKSESALNTLRYYIGIFILKQADIVRVVSQRIAISIVDTVGRNQGVNVLPIFTDYSKYTPVQRKKNNTVVNILCIARLVPQKNIKLLLQSFAYVHANNPNCRLTLVGDGYLRKKMYSHIQQLNILDVVELIPSTNTVSCLMHKADIFALSSNYEGWGLVLIEALASGLPIITTDVGCVSQVIMAKKHATVVPVNNQLQYQAALLELVNDPGLRYRYHQFSFEALANLRHQYVYETYAKQFIAAMTEVH